MSRPSDGRLVEFYDSSDEPGRLFRREGRVELVRTKRLLQWVLPEAPSRILDVGGADGVYARWLLGLGYDVQLIDLSSRHVDVATAAGLTAQVGHARDLPFDTSSFDAVLLLGPLYHLTDAQARLAALREASRVLRPQGVLAAAAVSRLAVAVDMYRKGRLGVAEALQQAKRIATHGYDDTGYGAGLFYFHTASELAAELEGAGFVGVRVHGIEGPVWPLIDPASTPDDATVELAAAVADMADDDASTAGASAHLLALATARADH
ncbi:MAG TPA: class I SAM-dependent methyltransferase [Egibacteraceae bacterium]|jgi:SAM-dependent methyltransferase|nr:class I SAM-dependent methyltransferase [Egibacteraceae bacterium]